MTYEFRKLNNEHANITVPPGTTTGTYKPNITQPLKHEKYKKYIK